MYWTSTSVFVRSLYLRKTQRNAKLEAFYLRNAKYEFFTEARRFSKETLHFSYSLLWFLPPHNNFYIEFNVLLDFWSDDISLSAFMFWNYHSHWLRNKMNECFSLLQIDRLIAKKSYSNWLRRNVLMWPWKTKLNILLWCSSNHFRI